MDQKKLSRIFINAFSKLTSNAHARKTKQVMVTVGLPCTSPRPLSQVSFRSLQFHSKPQQAHKVFALVPGSAWTTCYDFNSLKHVANHVPPCSTHGKWPIRWRMHRRGRILVTRPSQPTPKFLGVMQAKTSKIPRFCPGTVDGRNPVPPGMYKTL